MEALKNLNDVVVCAINSMDAGDSKKDVIHSITSYVKSKYIDMAEITDMENLSVTRAQWLHERFGIEFDVNAGNVIVRLRG